jgi:hypothetical protein
MQHNLKSWWDRCVAKSRWMALATAMQHNCLALALAPSFQFPWILQIYIYIYVLCFTIFLWVLVSGSFVRKSFGFLVISY